MRREHADTVKEERRCDHKTMRGGDLQYHGEKRGRVNKGRGDIQVSGAAARPVERKIAVGPLKYQQGVPSLELVRKATMEGGGGSASVRIFYWEVVQAVLLFGVET